MNQIVFEDCHIVLRDFILAKDGYQFECANI